MFEVVIVDDFSRYTWTHFLRSKDETPGVLIDFLTLVQRGLHAQVTTVRTDKGTEFLNKSLHAYFAKEGIRHETSTARTPEQNGVVERRNRTLVEAARTMLSAAKVPLFFWAEAIATAFKFFHIFGSLCYIIRDGENLDKMKEKGDACIFVGYSTQSKAYRVFNKRNKMIVVTIHVNFEELHQMASELVIQNKAGTDTACLQQKPMYVAIQRAAAQVLCHSHLVQSSPAFPYQAHRCQISLHTGTSLEKVIVELFFVGTEYQLAELFTKALSEDRFKSLVRQLGMRCLTPDELEVLAIESA
ncbi:retrovirus-related pol polyprotein from transposon TNT 1-94 [Tanacetum coccineum]